MLAVEIVGLPEVINRISGMPDKIRAQLFGKMTALALQLEGHVKRDKLQGQVLNHITGRLQQSIHHEVNQTGSNIVARVYSAAPMPYAAIHEFGGPVRTRLGQGKGPPKPGGKAVFQMPERSFMRSSLADYREMIINGMREAVSEAVKL